MFLVKQAEEAVAPTGLPSPLPPQSSAGPPGASISLCSEVPGPSCQGRFRGGRDAISMPCSEEDRSLLAGEWPS